MEEMSIYAEKGMELLWEYGPNLILALITLFIGLKVIKVIKKTITKAMEKGNVDVSLHTFLSSLVGITLQVLLIISVASMLGVQMTSFIAILGAAGLAVGLALQGSLANFAGGVLILLFKPFKVGDFIDAVGFSGTVQEIQVFSTKLTTPDNKTIIIPNGSLANSSMTNYSSQSQRRVDFVFGIGYNDDIKKTKSVLQGLIDKDQRILKDPEPVVVVSELADSSVNFTVRVWCNGSDYWGIYFDMMENVKLAFDENGISIPFPQRDIHVYNAQ